MSHVDACWWSHNGGKAHYFPPKSEVPPEHVLSHLMNGQVSVCRMASLCRESKQGGERCKVCQRMTEPKS